MGIVENAKSVVELVQKIDNLELYRQILDLHAEILAQVEENRGLKDKVRSLEERLAIKEALMFDGKNYWIEKPDAEREGPYCSVCWD